MKKIYLVPNLVTTGNLFCGFYSVVQTMQGEYANAAWLIVAAAFFDMLDGRVARFARATSSFGIEYDSLSDLASFAIAPPLLFYQVALQTYGKIGIACAFLFTACGAFRLARFNVNVANIPKGHFQGIPSPVAAVTFATFFLFFRSTEWMEEELFRPAALGLSVALGLLMVSTLPFPSFKELNWRSRASVGYLLVALGVLALIFLHPETNIFLAGIAYIALGFVQAIYIGLRRAPKAARPVNHEN
jgi:CDP-diacylglycerol--serine O-phosphatidyltransferase